MAYWKVEASSLFEVLSYWRGDDGTASHSLPALSHGCCSPGADSPWPILSLVPGHLLGCVSLDLWLRQAVLLPQANLLPLVRAGSQECCFDLKSCPGFGVCQNLFTVWHGSILQPVSPAPLECGWGSPGYLQSRLPGVSTCG